MTGSPRTATRYALPLSLTLPGNLPAPTVYAFATETSDEWYAVVAVADDGDAVIEDVRRQDWPLPEGVIDWRAVTA